jgi:ribulose-phosphate 3-epimerase
MPIIAPSILSADFLNLGKDIEMINQSQAEWIHIDVMDGVFVPNISYGIPIVKAVRKATGKILDVHLMIIQPERYFEAFRDAGADMITFHYEASVHLHRAVAMIHELDIKAGIVLNPHTPVNVLSEILPELDMVLLMSVNPGFGGQKFIANTYSKIATLKQMITANGKNILIEVDGGVDLSNASQLVQHGADVLVAGNTIFSSANPQETILKLKE